MKNEIQPIETAPYGKIILVKNDLMDTFVKATRGFTNNGIVHKNQTYFTAYPSGRLVCPTEWKYDD